jgi:hypothetical protein
MVVPNGLIVMNKAYCDIDRYQWYSDIVNIVISDSRIVVIVTSSSKQVVVTSSSSNSSIILIDQ